jgi:hypothetical protein
MKLTAILLAAFFYLALPVALPAQQITQVQQIDDPVAYIKKETIGGKLDFNKQLETQNQTMFVYEGVGYNKKDFAIYLWGRAVKALKIDSPKQAAKLWEEINNRSLTSSEKKALARGFNSKTN